MDTLELNPDDPLDTRTWRPCSSRRRFETAPLSTSRQALEHARPENRPPLERLETELEERLR